MDIVQKTNSKLEQFAIDSAKAFLSGSKSRARGYISLHGSDEEVLNSVREIMDRHLRQEYMAVEIKIRVRGGYSIDVDYYLN